MQLISTQLINLNALIVAQTIQYPTLINNKRPIRPEPAKKSISARCDGSLKKMSLVKRLAVNPIVLNVFRFGDTVKISMLYLQSAHSLSPQQWAVWWSHISVDPK